MTRGGTTPRRWTSLSTYALAFATALAAVPSAACGQAPRDGGGPEEPAARCGDGVRQPPEQCDGEDRAGATCAAASYEEGDVSCGEGCILNYGGCWSCGDGTATGKEACDRDDLRGLSCAALDYDGGWLLCDECALDTSACHLCGDGVRHGSEWCEGSDVGAQTCESQGFKSGVLGCTESCELDISGCVPFNPYAISFDGLDDIVDCGVMGLGLPLAEHTFEVWVKPDYGADGGLFHKWDPSYPLNASGPGPDTFSTRFIGGPTVSCMADFPCFDATWELSEGVLGSSIPMIPAEEWHHVAYTFAQNPGGWTDHTRYLDGVAFPGGSVTPSYVGELLDSPWPVLMGRDGCPGGECSTYEGAVDEIRIWDYGRTAMEIAAAMNVRLTGTEPGLVAYWPFEEGMGQFTFDAVTGTMCRFGATTAADPDDPAWTTDTPF